MVSVFIKATPREQMNWLNESKLRTAYKTADEKHYQSYGGNNTVR